MLLHRQRQLTVALTPLTSLYCDYHALCLRTTATMVFGYARPHITCDGMFYVGPRSGLSYKPFVLEFALKELYSDLKYHR